MSVVFYDTDINKNISFRPIVSFYHFLLSFPFSKYKNKIDETIFITLMEYYYKKNFSLPQYVEFKSVCFKRVNIEFKVKAYFDQFTTIQQRDRII